MYVVVYNSAAFLSYAKITERVWRHGNRASNNQTARLHGAIVYGDHVCVRGRGDASGKMSMYYEFRTKTDWKKNDNEALTKASETSKKRTLELRQDEPDDDKEDRRGRGDDTVRPEDRPTDEALERVP